MFFLLPIHVRGANVRETVPLVNAIIVILNVLAYAFGAGENWAVGQRTGIFSMLTYGFAHAGIWHLAANMWVLLVFGNPVNRRLGNGFYALLYFGTILAMGVFARLFCNGYLVGASGGIFAVIAVFLFLMPGSILEMYYFALFPVTLLIGLISRPPHLVYWFIRWDSFNIRAVWAILIVPMLEIWGLFWWGWNWTNLGHLCGLLCGVAAVLLLPTKITMNSSRRMAWD